MILDLIDRGHHYAELHPLFSRAFEFLRTTDLSTLQVGRHEIQGEELYATVDETRGRGREGARLEHHRRYIDIQVCLSGDEQIGWMPLDCCVTRSGGFDGPRDVGFFEDLAETWFTLAPGRFAVFFPADAHAPLAGSGEVRKVVVKILV